jgi:hypothetical protein
MLNATCSDGRLVHHYVYFRAVTSLHSKFELLPGVSDFGLRGCALALALTHENQGVSVLKAETIELFLRIIFGNDGFQCLSCQSDSEFFNSIVAFCMKLDKVTP